MSFNYIVSYSTSANGPWTKAGTSSAANLDINGLTPGTNYWVQIITVDSVTGLQSDPAVGGPFQASQTTTHKESPDGTTVTASGQTITSSKTPGQAAPANGPFDTWTITGGRVVHNGVSDSTTANVQELLYKSHTVYQKESTGNSFGTPGWWQWAGGSSVPSATPGSGSFNDPKGNAWSLNSSGSPVINGHVDTVSHCKVLYLIGSTIWQSDVNNQWYSITPSGTINSASLDWNGPTAAPQLTAGWVPCVSPLGGVLTITGISLSNNTVSSTAPAGTTVGAISVGMSSGSFSGSLSLSGTSSFALSGHNLTTARSLAAGNYSVGLTATQPGASNSPFGPKAFSITSQTGSTTSYDHIVVVMEENHGYGDIIGSSQAPYINSLANGGALLTNYFAVTHPSEPNYLALYAGSDFGVGDDKFHAEQDPSLFTALKAAGKTFVGYVEGGSPEKHNPWEAFPEGTSVEQDFSTFPSDFTQLPDVAFVIPNLNDDMHDGTIEQADTWLRNNIDAYAQWAKTHNSLLIITWDEDDSNGNNQVATILYGNVKQGQYGAHYDHYSLLKTICQLTGATPIRNAANATAISGMFSGGGGGGGGGGTGPAASSNFITAEFQQPFNYPHGSGQQVVSPFCYGNMSSSWTDKLGQGDDYFANDSYMTTFGKINPGLLIHKAPGRMFNDDLSINKGAIDNMLKNTYKWFPDVAGGVVFDLPGFSAQNWQTLSSSQYAQLHADFTNYVFNYTMGNGQKFPLVGMGGEDESGMDNGTMQQYYNAFIPRVKAVSNNLLIFGPTNSTPDPKDFANGVSGLDVFCGNGFTNIHGNADSMDALNQWVAGQTWGDQVSGNNLRYMGFSSGGSDWDCQGGQLFSYPEAMLHCKQVISNLNSARVGTICSFWGGIDDCGLMSYDPTIYPIGYWFAQGVRHTTGPRWQVPTNNTGMLTVAVTPAKSRFGLLVFNVGNGNKSGSVALSHWPVNSTGNGTANVWQMTSSSNGPGKDGRSSTVNVTAGVTSSINFPDPSITILWM